MSADFQNAVPRNFLIPQPVSTSKSVLRKTLMEMLPNEQTTYSPADNNIITFNISSNISYLSELRRFYFYKWSIGQFCQSTYHTGKYPSQCGGNHSKTEFP